MANKKTPMPPSDEGDDDRFRDSDEPEGDEGNDDRLGGSYEPEVNEGGTDFDPERLEADSTPPEPPDRDIYDPAFLGLGQDFATEANVAKKWDIIKVEKPSKSRVFRVHPTMRLKTMLLVLKEDNEVYLIHPSLRKALKDESLCGYFTLFACITKAGTPFLWPIRMADADGKWNVWHQSAWHIAEKAQTNWARMQANRDAGHYVAEYDQRPPGQQQPPAWPDLTFRDWLELAFRGFTIDSVDHPVLRRLRMED
jgi:hypothetical protein